LPPIFRHIATIVMMPIAIERAIFAMICRLFRRAPYVDAMRHAERRHGRFEGYYHLRCYYAMLVAMPYAAVFRRRRF